MDSVSYFGEDVGTEVDSVDLDAGILTLTFIATDDHITDAGTLDEGLVATIADNNTSTLLAVVGTARGGSVATSVSVSLSVQACAAIAPNTPVEVICKVTNPQLSHPHALATFRSTTDPAVVYAVCGHTKFAKDVLGKL
ncbi:hypothetical protein DL89DRAFT_264832 [Linderina pennispora]|uniref:Uncharacterized protein n=1 Tax=Linderina pennispora TaxID=61395 RepID=A0A1Y1WGE1_9FUNG|nr:uncharacterized protein DL89DRAFT_264832 [Linderina pennispora]ORX72611.1 hypothetical protein DL89DRAFT_264832 [Linderina pennispora]